MPAEQTSGSQTATIGTEHTLATVTATGIYVLRVDINAMTAGDILELRLYAKARNTDTERLLHGPAIYGPIVSEQKLIDSIPVVIFGHLKVTLKQTAGTGRAYPWVVLNTA